jgi:hypothetical protein
VTLSVRRGPRRARTLAFALIAVIFAYTTLANVIERPEGVQVASFFIAAIITVSFASRINRAFELRCRTVTFDDTATSLIDAAAHTSQIHIVTHDPHERSMLEYQDKEIQQRAESHIPAAEQIIFLEVNVTDASEFSTDLEVHGRIHVGGYRTLWVNAAAIPNTIAATLIAIRDRTGLNPNVYFEWSEGDPILNLLRFLFIGEGEVAPVTREVLRRAVTDLQDRPKVHVG